MLDTKLRPGEQVAVRHRRLLTRKGRCVVKARIVGYKSLAWLEAAALWGATVEVFVCREGEVKHLVNQLYPDVHLSLPAAAAAMLPHRVWDRILFGTIVSQEDAVDVNLLVEAWKPASIVLATHASIPARSVLAWLTIDPRWGYGDHTRYQHFRCTHAEMGGVTRTAWRFYHRSRECEPYLELSLPGMTAGAYPRVLQTALDDTLGPPMGNYRLRLSETRQEDGAIGLVFGHRIPGGGMPVFDSRTLGPDLHVLNRWQRKQIWVRAETVFAKDPCLRRMSDIEVMSTWDYVDKASRARLNHTDRVRLVLNRLASPPGKMVNAAVFLTCQQALEGILPRTLVDLTPIDPTSATRGDKVGPAKLGLLEEKVGARVKAAVADNAAVDLDFWAVPGETEAQKAARVVLRRFVHR